MTGTLGRRAFLASLSALALVAALPRSALALTADQATDLVGKVVSEIHTVINSGKAEAAMYKDFAQIFVKYADVPTVARYCLGQDARRATAAQLNAFTSAYVGYISRKYGSRFREFAGGTIEVQGTRAVKSYFEVQSVAKLRGQSPFEVTFLVSDKSGKSLFFDMYVEGVSMLKSERTEIGAMIDRRKGDLDGMIADLNKAG